MTDLIAEACIALRLEATTEEIFRTIHAHPTLPEALMQAAEAVYGRRDRRLGLEGDRAGGAWPTSIMPQMGESIAEGTITKWLKKVGDKVERDEPLFEISTDKVDAEIPSPAAGVLKEIRVAPGHDGARSTRSWA